MEELFVVIVMMNFVLLGEVFGVEIGLRFVIESVVVEILWEI